MRCPKPPKPTLTPSFCQFLEKIVPYSLAGENVELC